MALFILYKIRFSIEYIIQFIWIFVIMGLFMKKFENKEDILDKCGILNT